MTPEQRRKRELQYVIQQAVAQMANTLPEGPGCHATVHTVAGNVAVIQAGHTNNKVWTEHNEGSEEQCDK